MLEWIIYKKGDPRNIYLAAGTAYSAAEARDQAREHLLWLQEEGLLPTEKIQLVIETSVSYEGTVEGYMGQTALKRLGLS